MLEERIQSQVVFAAVVKGLFHLARSVVNELCEARVKNFRIIYGGSEGTE